MRVQREKHRFIFFTYSFLNPIRRVFTKPFLPHPPVFFLPLWLVSFRVQCIAEAQHVIKMCSFFLEIYEEIPVADPRLPVKRAFTPGKANQRHLFQKKGTTKKCIFSSSRFSVQRSAFSATKTRLVLPYLSYQSFLNGWHNFLFTYERCALMSGYSYVNLLSILIRLVSTGRSATLLFFSVVSILLFLWPQRGFLFTAQVVSGSVLQ